MRRGKKVYLSQSHLEVPDRSTTHLNFFTVDILSLLDLTILIGHGEKMQVHANSGNSANAPSRDFRMTVVGVNWSR